MKKEVLLEQMVDMMSTINEGTLRSSRIYYYVDVSKYPPTKLMKFVIEKIRETTGRYYTLKNIDPIINKLQGRMYAKSSFDDSGAIDLDFYFTKESYSFEELSSLILQANGKADQNPDFARGSFLLDSEKIQLRSQPIGKKIKYLHTASERSDAVELEYLADLNRRLADGGMSKENPMDLKIGTNIFSGVAGFIKNPETNATADFVAIDSQEQIIPGTGISHKAPPFESYKNLTSFISVSDDEANHTTRDVDKFIDVVKSKWRQRLLYPARGDQPVRPTAGFYRPTKKDKSRNIDLVYGKRGNRAEFIVIGEFDIAKVKDQTLEVSVQGEGELYQYPEIPSGKHTPVLYSRFGTKGHNINLNVQDLATLSTLFPELKGDGLVNKLEEFKLQDISVVQPMGIDTPIIKSANLSIRLFSIPQYRLPKKAEQV